LGEPAAYLTGPLFAVYVPKLGNPRMFGQAIMCSREDVRDAYLAGSPDITNSPHILVRAEERSSLQPLMTMQELRELGATPVNMEWPKEELHELGAVPVSGGWPVQRKGAARLRPCTPLDDDQGSPSTIGRRW